MNTPTQPKDQDTRPKVDQRRRMLAKGGLAAPIVLGALMSRPVLGAAPYHCTISGQMSGNVSPRPGADTNCASLGKSPAYWRDLAAFGTTGVNKTALFTSLGFVDTYWKRNNNQRLVAPNANNSQVATLQQVLANLIANNNPPTNVPLGRAAIASYLNAIEFAPNYPLSKEEVVAMFNATIGGGTYMNGWNSAQVLAYFESLYQ